MATKETKTWTVEDLSAGLNLVKKDLPTVFTKVSLVNMLRDLKYPVYNTVPLALSSLGYIILSPTMKDRYEWASSEPIHINKIQEIINMAKLKAKQYQKNSKDKKKGVKTPVADTTDSHIDKTPVADTIPEDIYTPTDEEQYWIDKLYERGYRVTRPIVKQLLMKPKNL